jgi:hypothetical protein
VGGVPDADPDLGFEDCVICILQCCGSGMFIPDPIFIHLGSRIPDPDPHLWFLLYFFVF